MQQRQLQVVGTEAAIKIWLNGTFLNALSSALRGVISECRKYTDNIGGKNNTESAVTITLQKIWLLSEFEVFGSTRFANPYEQNKQVQYEYFKNGNSRLHVIHSDITSAEYWWLRSHVAETTNEFCGVTHQGYPLNGDEANSFCAFNPCFTIGGQYW